MEDSLIENFRLAVSMDSVFINFMSAFEKAPKNYKWERAYPGILDAEDTDNEDVTVTQQLDQMLKRMILFPQVIYFQLLQKKVEF